MWAQNVLWEGFSCKTHICCDFLAHCYFLLSRLGNIDPDPDVNNKGHLNASEFLASTWLVNWGSIAFGKGLSARLRRRSLLMPIAATFFSRALLMEWECSCCIGWCWQWEIRGGGVLQNSALHLPLLSVRTFLWYSRPYIYLLKILIWWWQWPRQLSTKFVTEIPSNILPVCYHYLFMGHYLYLYFKLLFLYGKLQKFAKYFGRHSVLRKWP